MISNHLHPNIAFHRWVGRLALLGLGGVLFGTAGLVYAAFAYGAGLMLVMIPFLWGLSLPLFLLTSLYPGVIVHENGVELRPYGFRRTLLVWDDMLALTENSLLKPPPPSKLRRVTHVGAMILVKSDKLPVHYRVVGLIAGVGWKPIFGISNKTHADYEALLLAFQERLPQRKLNDA